jgi:hypothetical protein
MRVMQDMELSDDEKLDRMGLSEAPVKIANKKEYPWGLKLRLTERELDKLGLEYPDDTMVDGIVHFHGMGRISGVKCEQRIGEPKCCCVEIETTHFSIESEDEENEEEDE